MKVLNRAGEQCDVSLDEIKMRIARLCTPEELAAIDIDTIVIRTVNGIFDGITTSELDELSARLSAEMQAVHPLYDALAARIMASNIAKNARRLLLGGGPGLKAATYSAKVAFVAARLPGLFDPAYVAYVAANADALDAMIVQERDATHSFFALRTLEVSYLLRVDGRVVETPQDMWLRVAVALHLPRTDDEDGGVALANIKRTYELTSTGKFTHATPTLFNAGMATQQCR